LVKRNAYFIIDLKGYKNVQSTREWSVYMFTKTKRRLVSYIVSIKLVFVDHRSTDLAVAEILFGIFYYFTTPTQSINR
jgi:hypothetical protein